MSRPSRLLGPLLGVLLSTALTGCTLVNASTDEPAPAPTDPASALPEPGAPTTVGDGQVSLFQKLGAYGPLRTLQVEKNGTWKCLDCAGDGVTSTGGFAPEQVSRLQQLLADPGLAAETDQARHYRSTCIDALTSSLLTAVGSITTEDCPGVEAPPIAGEVLLLLTQATPAELTEQ
ncbi:hypothetical protein [Micromonospora musae]|uniref:DUF732 domain-containing protein n=1 Tax=Micromonospora musae TaxID=1894970 RepID=A0A3A9Y0Y5_9ACTN|nr:hypothetical protein [Micromonospora musae]RKN31095.1 hypothetical protein D7044_17735 [Micromonospora musae]